MNYWQERNLKAQQELTSKSIAETEKQLIKYYKRTMRTVINDFEATYDKLLATIGDGKAPTPADLYKLEKYWQMQGLIDRELTKLGNVEMKLMTKVFTEQYQAIYDAVAFLGDSKSFNSIDRATAEQMINAIWCADGKSWSSRIWTNTEKLKEALNTNLIDCVVAGKKTTELKNLLQEQFGVSYSRADSIVRTELAHIQTQAAQQRYKDYGLQEVEIWADKDERRCEVCGKLHGKRYPMGAQVPIPAHPRCRCTILPVVEENRLTVVEK